MKFFIDSADIEEIAAADKTGLIDGVTTNPSLIAKTGRKPMDVYRELEQMGIQDISMEVMGDHDEMFSQALELRKHFGDVVTVKLPMTVEGLQVCSHLRDMEIRTNVTLIFNLPQAILAAKAGATYVSPFVGRIDDQGYAGLEVVRGISQMFSVGGLNTQVLAASIRTPHRAVRSFFNGAQIVTMPPKVFWQMYGHVLTDVGLDIFEKDSHNK